MKLYKILLSKCRVVNKNEYIAKKSIKYHERFYNLVKLDCDVLKYLKNKNNR